MAETYIIAGGDMRFAAAAEAFASKGFRTVALYPSGDPGGAEISMNSGGMPPADCLILPLPVSNDGIHLNAPAAAEPVKLSELTGLVRRGGSVFGGKVTDKVRSVFAQKNIYVTDYLDSEELAVMNALATAEGAVMLALQMQSIMLYRQKILILGMGRIAKALIRVLSGFGADITAAARKSSYRAKARVMGCRAISIEEYEHSPDGYTLIFNTIPAPVTDSSVLEHMDKNALIIDLASAPGGTDFAAAEHLGIRAVNALGIPGKTAPRSAGAMIADAIENIVSERRKLNE